MKNAGLEMMGDNFQPGILTPVIDGEARGVTPIPNFFRLFFCGGFRTFNGRPLKHPPPVPGSFCPRLATWRAIWGE